MGAPPCPPPRPAVGIRRASGAHSDLTQQGNLPGLQKTGHRPQEHSCPRPPGERHLTEEPSWAEGSWASPAPGRGPPVAPSPAAAVQRCDDPGWDVPPLGRASSGCDKDPQSPPHTGLEDIQAGNHPRPGPNLTSDPPAGTGGAWIKSPVHRPLRSIIRAFVENQLIRQSTKAVKMII